eukprot:TRINITY_DN7472_c0_g2_i1.p1 TRINITY_DN7472_c0_g2~~TRINITY_DN7472_c0_g2_i1.p1  ORF type:complete len:112 (+),score=5.44 TRINITY_DN7472_c0_g2_i1:6-341(+)
MDLNKSLMRKMLTMCKGFGANFPFRQELCRGKGDKNRTILGESGKSREIQVGQLQMPFVKRGGNDHHNIRKCRSEVPQNLIRSCLELRLASRKMSLLLHPYQRTNCPIDHS